MMKYLALIFVAFGFSTFTAWAQLASKMIDYMPAPGQLINTDAAGSTKAANSVVGSLSSGIVSLGAFGGAVVYGFDQPVKNDPANPYGVDFVIFGNVQPDWAEPGVVMVMKDENKNGLPDDRWYELAGSEYFFSTTRHHATVTYYNPLLSGDSDVSWVYGNEKGYVYSNSFHKQDYFPSELLLGGTVAETIQVSGTLIDDQVDLSNPANVKCFHRRFGYADNNLRKNLNYQLPDNPYTLETEGCGGDAMDISWAVDDAGEYVDLDQIDFVKIYTGVLANAGWCGEISTEITGIADVPSNSSLTGETSCVVINRPSGKLLAGETLHLEALYFKAGRVAKGEKIEWLIDNSQVATIDADGLLRFLHQGTASVSASLASNPLINAKMSITVVDPSAVVIKMESSAVQINEELPLTAVVNSAGGNTIEGLPLIWKSSDSLVVSVTERNGKWYGKGRKEGRATLEVTLKDRPEIRNSAIVTVMPESSSKEVFVTVKDEFSTFVPRDRFSIDPFNLNPFVDKASGDYGIDKTSGVTVAHVIANVFSSMGLAGDLRFRDDQKSGGKLYLWKVPKGDASSVELLYGYGGYAHSKSWVVLLNNEQLVGGLDQKLVNSNDEIMIYHVPNISVDWQVSCFIPNKNEVTINDTLEVYSSELTCALSAEGKVIVKSSSPIMDQQVLVDNSEVYFNGDPVVTDEMGTATLRFTEAGRKRIAAGIDELMVAVKSKVASPANHINSNTKVWPSPATGWLNVSFVENGDYRLTVTDLSGRQINSIVVSKQSETILSTSDWGRGLFILSVSGPKGSSNHKIIVQ